MPLSDEKEIVFDWKEVGRFFGMVRLMGGGVATFSGTGP